MLFDFVDADGYIFVAIIAHTARFQFYFTEGDFNGESRTLSLTNPLVDKGYKGLVILHKFLTAEANALERSRTRTLPATGVGDTRWGEPMVLFSKGAKEI